MLGAAHVTAAQEALWYAVYADVAAGLDGRLQPRSRTRRCTGSRLGDRLLSPQPAPVRLAHRRGLQPAAVRIHAAGPPARPAAVADIRAAALRRPVGMDALQPAAGDDPAGTGRRSQGGRRAGPGRPGHGRRPAACPPVGGPPAAVVAWTLALAWPVGLYAMVAAYDGHGGHTHPRYLFPGLATLAAVGRSRPGPARRRPPWPVGRRCGAGATGLDRCGLGRVVLLKRRPADGLATAW
jgi:hypothetical protein